MASSTSLLDWILSLLRDPDQRAAFQADPQGYAHDHGFGDLSSADVHDALCLIADNQSASYDHDKHHVHYPPPHYPDHHEHDAGHYLNNYITNNYKIIDNHDTHIDDSVHERVNTHGGDFNQTIDNDPVVASGHALASGHDIHDSNIATGDDDVAGHDNNVIDGDHNTTAFGSGDATNTDLDHAHFGSGSAVAIDGDAHSDASQHNTTTVVDGGHGPGPTSVNVADEHGDADQHADQAHTHNTMHTNYEDNSHTSIHDDYNSHNNTDIDDSHHTHADVH